MTRVNCMKLLGKSDINKNTALNSKSTVYVVFILNKKVPTMYKYTKINQIQNWKSWVGAEQTKKINNNKKGRARLCKLDRACFNETNPLTNHNSNAWG